MQDWRGKSCICAYGIGHPNVKEHTATCNDYQTMSSTIAAQEAEIARLRDAVKRSFTLGQHYWQMADSEYPSHHKKADQIEAMYRALLLPPTTEG